jgi:hypothetical protein
VKLNQWCGSGLRALTETKSGHLLVPARFHATPDDDYFIRCCLNQFSAGVEAPWKPLT